MKKKVLAVLALILLAAGVAAVSRRLEAQANAELWAAATDELD